MLEIEYIDYEIPVYDITVADNNNFYADGIVIHNCQEITLPTSPLYNVNDENGLISLCVLAAINLGNIKTPSDFEKPCSLIVRALNNLIDYQEYLLPAAENAMKTYRPIGVGITNLAYWLAKNDTSYQNPNLELFDEYMEAWSYYLIKASVDMAKERGPIPGIEDVKYGDGIFPIHTYKKEVDNLVKSNYKMDWDTLVKDAIEYGIFNATLMAAMPAESSSVINNSTNGIEPIRSFITTKKSKNAIITQIAPEFKKLKNKYDLLWDQKSPQGYLRLVAVLQKYIDQSISTNTSYNPKFYNDEIPMSVLLNDMLLCYKWGIKTGYYFQTAPATNEEENQAECEGCSV